MSFAAAEAERRIAQMVTIGRVSAVYHDGTARVQIGDLASPPLPVGKLRAGGMQVWWMPTVGEQVLVAAPSGDMARGVIVCGILAGNAPSSDVSVPMIDLRGGEMVIKGSKLVIEADLDVTGRMDITGDVASQSNLLAQQGIAAGGTAPVDGAMTASGNIETTADVIAGDVSLKQHTHDGVTAGGAETGAPV